MSNYRLSDTAEDDLVRIYHWDINVMDKRKRMSIWRPFSIILNYSHSSPFPHPVTEIREGYRRSACGSDNVYYRIRNGIVEIMANIGSQDA